MHIIVNGGALEQNRRHMWLCFQDSNKNRIGIHYFKVLVQIHYSRSPARGFLGGELFCNIFSRFLVKSWENRDWTSGLTRLLVHKVWLATAESPYLLTLFNFQFYCYASNRETKENWGALLDEVELAPAESPYLLADLLDPFRWILFPCSIFLGHIIFSGFNLIFPCWFQFRWT